MEPSDIEKVITELLSPQGFRKKRRNWYVHSSETIGVLTFSTRFGGEYYLDLGIFARALTASEYPPQQKCNVRARLSDLCPPDVDLGRALNLDDTSLSDTLRLATILQAVECYALPVLRECSTLRKLRMTIQRYPTKFFPDLAIRALLDRAERSKWREV